MVLTIASRKWVELTTPGTVGTRAATVVVVIAVVVVAALVLAAKMETVVVSLVLVPGRRC